MRILCSVLLLLGGATDGWSQTIAPIPDSYPDSPVKSILEPLQVEQQDITFLTAATAEVSQQEDGTVAILATELRPEREVGKLLTVTGQPVDFIEVHPEKNPFPPFVLEPLRPNVFLLQGSPGDKLFVSIRAAGQPPTWEVVVIAGPPGDPDNPIKPPPSEDLQALVRQIVDSPGLRNDPATREQLKKSISAACDHVEGLCNNMQCPTLPGAKRMVTDVIDARLRARDSSSLKHDWHSLFRKPVSAAIDEKNPADVATYLSLMRSVAAGL